METDKTKTVSRSESTTNRKPTAGKALAGKRANRAANRSAAGQTAEINPQERAERIARAAYFLAEQRAFAPNHELDDWLAAEQSL